MGRLNRDAWISGLAQGAISITFAIGVGRWIERIIEQSKERQVLLEQLESTRTELAAAHREAGVGAERQRLAGEIHDTLAQGFMSIVLLAQAARASAGTGPAQGYLDAIERTARENLAEARALVAELAPPALAAGSLPAAASRLVERLGVEVGLDARLVVEGTPRSLDPERDVALLRALQEGLANVRRHASAAHVAVSLDYGASTVVLALRDDGCGFDPSTDAASAGFGLGGMRTRLELVGGSADVRSAPGEGTVVRAWVGAALVDELAPPSMPAPTVPS